MTGAETPSYSETGHRELIARLQGRIDEVLKSILPPAGSGEPYAVLDFPDYANVGDSAIWAGELTWLNRHFGAPPAAVARLDPDAVLPQGPVFINGGGNFGDLWPQHQTFRETLLARHPRRTIVQLPQSIHYDDPAAVERTARAIARHGAFTLLVRDRESYDLACARFDCRTLLCPDMAFALGPVERPREPAYDVLLLLRNDKETQGAAAALPALPDGWLCRDWLDETPRYREKSWLKSRLHASKSRRRAAFFDRLAEQRIGRGLDLLSSARVIVTDRLHAHILATLLGIPHVVLDNSYGKIARFSSAFDARWSGARRADNIEEAILIARGML